MKKPGASRAPGQGRETGRNTVSSSHHSKELFNLSSLASEGYPGEANIFLDTLFGEFTNCFIEVRLVKGESVLQFFYPSISAVQWGLIKGKNSEGYNCYFGVCLRKTQKGDKSSVASISALWGDLDGKNFAGGKPEALAQLQQLPPYLYPSIILDTGHGYHPYWLLRETEPVESPQEILKVEAYMKGLAFTLHGDSTSDLSRVLRLPGLVNQKDTNNPCLCHIIHWEPERRFNPMDFDDYQAEIRESEPKRAGEAKKWPQRSDEFNKLAVEKLLETCPFIQCCRDNAITLAEPWWWGMVSNLVPFGEPGRQKIHELSAPYRKYTEKETNQKILEALKAASKEVGPHTCTFIEQNLGFSCPADCLAKKERVKSPAGLAARLAAPIRVNLTDLGNAERLVSWHGENIRYSEERKRWLIWNGQFWEWDFGAKVMALAKKTARNILREAADEKDDERRKELIKHAVRSESEARLTAMVTLAQSELGVPVENKELNPNPWLFNCPNGTVDLRTGELLSHNREDLITIMSPVSYDPHAPCELWLKFLDRVTGGSTELAQYLQRAVGYSLTGDMRAQVLFFLFGLGNNGKSTFISTIRKVTAGYGAKAPVDMFLAKDKNARGPREDLANLQGKRFIAASEVEVGRKLAVVIIKEMTGGEAIRADRKYEHEVEFQPTHKLWISGNHKPVIVDTSLAIWRRIKLIPFTVTIPDDEIDEDLPFKMEAELSGILAWAVEGCLAWQQSGLAEPRVVTAATLAYRSEEDILAEFIQDCCSLKTTATVPKADLHERYKRWCEATDNQPVYQKTLRTRLMERGITEGKSGSVRYWRGITLVEGKEEGQMGQEEKEGQLGREMTFPQESPIREEIQGKVPGNWSPAVPNVPDDVQENLLGMPVLKIVDIWTKAGKPIIHLGPGRNCLDLEKFLGGPATEEDLKAVREWMERKANE
ncbi:hypothetical protein ES703_29685 [subsurface metagenome]